MQAVQLPPRHARTTTSTQPPNFVLAGRPVPNRPWHTPHTRTHTPRVLQNSRPCGGSRACALQQTHAALRCACAQCAATARPTGATTQRAERPGTSTPTHLGAQRSVPCGAGVSPRGGGCSWTMQCRHRGAQALSRAPRRHARGAAATASRAPSAPRSSHTHNACEAACTSPRTLQWIPCVWCRVHAPTRRLAHKSCAAHLAPPPPPARELKEGNIM
jgi:hypothetical protein